MMQNNPHDQKVALVTGANKGIGREIARQFAALGMHVLVGSRDPRRGEQAAAALRADGGDVDALELDVTDPRTVQAAAAQIEERFGRLDVLVNNAGISGADAGRSRGVSNQVPGTVELDVVRAVLDTNVVGVVAVTEAMLPLLRRTPEARIVNVSSSVGSVTLASDPTHYFARMPAGVAYPVSKAALNMLTVQYAKAGRDDGILVNAADPGACATDFTAHLDFPIARTAADGAAIAVRLATLEKDGPTGGLFNDDGPVPW